MAFQLRVLETRDREWANSVIEREWASTRIVSRGKVHCSDSLPGFIAIQKNQKVGLVIYRIDEQECEIITLKSLVEGIGIGSSLITVVRDIAISNGCKRLWLVTTNDNLSAMRYYQKRGFMFAAVHRYAVEQSRQLKPEIPLIGIDGIPIRDEIELELPL